MVKIRKKSPFYFSKTALLAVIFGCLTVFIPLIVSAQDDEDEQSSLEKIEQHAQTLKDLVEKYQKAEIDIIKKEKVQIVDIQGAPQDCDVAIFYNNGNQARFTTSGGSFEGNFDHGKKLPTRPYSIRLSGCACRVVSTTHSSSLQEINEVIEKIKKVVEGEIEGKAQEKAKEYAEKGVQKIFDKLGYGASASGFLSGFGYGASLGQPIGDYLTESINQILDTYREKNLEAAEHHDFEPLYPGVGHLNPRGRIGNFFGSNPQMTNTWNVVVHCGTREIPPSQAQWHKIKDPIRTPPPPQTYAPETSDEERRIAEEQERERERELQEEQRRWEQEKSKREAESRRRQEEARRKYEAEQHRIRQKAQEIMKTCPICDPIRQHIETVTKRISETEQQIPELQNAVIDAQKTLDDANKKTQQAEEKLSDFRNPDSWVESNGRRITSTDLEVQKELSRDNWRRYMDGEQNAEETMENWGNQSDPERHERAKKQVEERLEKAVEEAKEAAQEAQRNLNEANRKLGEAEQLLNQQKNRKEELEKLLEDCLKKCRAQAEDIARGDITTYEELLDIETLSNPEPAEQPKTSPEPTESSEEPTPSDDISEENPATDNQTETSQMINDSDEVYFDDPIQTDSYAFRDVFGSSFKVGAKLDWATRSSFEDAVCAQDGLSDCMVDGITPVLVFFGEVSLFNWDLTDQGIGVVPISAGVAFTLSEVAFEQNHDYGRASPLPYNINGDVGILGLDTYVHASRSFNPVQTLPGKPAFSPYLNLGISNLWNCGDFEFLSDDLEEHYHREHHGVHFIGGVGTDVNFGGKWGTRLNLDYIAGGADANLRFGVGVTRKF